MDKELSQNIPHYLSNHFKNELIHLMSKNIQQEILKCLRTAKYYYIILDETPDASHVVLNTTGERLFNFLREEILSKFEIGLYDMRGQG